MISLEGYSLEGFRTESRREMSALSPERDYKLIFMTKREGDMNLEQHEALLVTLQFEPSPAFA
jgi:hypothetical protein